MYFHLFIVHSVHVKVNGGAAWLVFWREGGKGMWVIWMAGQSDWAQACWRIDVLGSKSRLRNSFITGKRTKFPTKPV